MGVPKPIIDLFAPLHLVGSGVEALAAHSAGFEVASVRANHRSRSSRTEAGSAIATVPLTLVQSAPIKREKVGKIRHGTVAAALRSGLQIFRKLGDNGRGRQAQAYGWLKRCRRRAELLATAECNNSLMARLIIAAKQWIERTRQILESIAQSAADDGPRSEAR